MSFPLCTEELFNLAEGHVDRVIEAMGIDELKSYAKQMMKDTYFDSKGNIDRYTQSALLDDMLSQEDGDVDSLFEFMVGAGIQEDRAQKAIDVM
jgi:hypothetical protein